MTPNDRPQYRTAVDYRSRFSTTIIGDITNAIEVHVKNIDQMVSGIFPLMVANPERNISPSKYAWEGKVLYEAGSLNQRTLLVTLLRTKFESVTFQHQKLVP
jgi:hypothetical protein